jgi:hypothetical protein
MFAKNLQADVLNESGQQKQFALSGFRKAYDDCLLM